MNDIVKELKEILTEKIEGCNRNMKIFGINQEDMIFERNIYEEILDEIEHLEKLKEESYNGKDNESTSK